MVFPRNSAIRKQVNVTLLALREDGTYQKLYDKWFTNK
jgi:polar amino acid transport system substrate-binding protein